MRTTLYPDGNDSARRRARVIPAKEPPITTTFWDEGRFFHV